MNSSINSNQSYDFLSTPIYSEQQFPNSVLPIILVIIAFSFMIAICYRHLKKAIVSNHAKNDILLEDIKRESSNEIFQIPQRKSSAKTTNEIWMENKKYQNSLPSTSSESTIEISKANKNEQFSFFWPSCNYGLV